jgi:glycosyltransferase involved in cell wall biosynthesis
MSAKKNIVFVSISCDLYGSSKVLLSLVLHMKQQSSEYNPIVCLPPEEGLLRAKLQEAGVPIIEMPVVKLKRSMLKSFGLFSLVGEYFKARLIFRKATKDISVDCIHSNTLATLFGAIYCKFRKTKHILHVHEIMDSPKAAAYFFKNILKYCSDHVVYNSEATAKFYNEQSPSLKRKSVTIVNGVDRNGEAISEEERTSIRKELFHVGKEDIVMGLVGRINRLKGHEITLDVFSEIANEYPTLQVRFIGSTPPGQDHFLVNLQDKIRRMNLEDRVRIIGFQEDVFPLFESMDFAVVPSTEAESFGLVVVEAMLAGKAVIGSDIGGIATIIDHNNTGLLFDPESKESYKSALKKLLDDVQLKQKLEERALSVAKSEYTTERMYRKFIELYNKEL